MFLFIGGNNLLDKTQDHMLLRKNKIKLTTLKCKNVCDKICWKPSN